MMILFLDKKIFVTKVFRFKEGKLERNFSLVFYEWILSDISEQMEKASYFFDDKIDFAEDTEYGNQYITIGKKQSVDIFKRIINRLIKKGELEGELYELGGLLYRK